MTEIPCELCLAKDEEYRFVAGNDEAFCVVNWEPIKDGHVMVLPRRHVTSLGDLTQPEAQAVLALVDDIKGRIQKQYGEDPIIGMNTGSHGSQIHLHIHVIPSRGGLRELFQAAEGVPFRQRATPEKLTEIRDRLQ